MQKLEYVSDEYLDLLQYFNWFTYQKHTALEIKKKLTRPLQAEVRQLFTSFGGVEYKRNCWQFTYDVKSDLEKAAAHGYYPNLLDNVSYFPPQVMKSVLAHANLEKRILLIFPGYGTLSQTVSKRNSEADIFLTEADGVEEYQNIDFAYYEKLSDIKSKFDLIIMRPPFMGRQDIDLIYRAYDKLNVGGKLITFIKADIEYCNNKECEKFRQWCINKNIQQYQIDSFCWSRDTTINLNVFLFILSKEI